MADPKQSIYHKLLLKIYFLDRDVQIPYLGKQMLFLGLPHNISYIMSKFYNVHDPQANGHGIVCIGKLHHNIICSNSDDPLPLQNIYFATKDGSIQSASEKLQYPTQLIPGHDYAVAFGGYIFDEEGKLKLVKIFYDRENNLFETIYSDRIAIHDTYIVTPMEKLSTYKYNVKLQPFLEREEYKFLDSPAYWPSLFNFIDTYPHPDFLDQCYQIYEQDLLGHVIIRCLNDNIQDYNIDQIIFPNYIRPFLGPHSPIYYHGAYEQKSYHEISSPELRFIIRALIKLIMRKQLININELTSTEINIDEWIHICNYFDIPYFEKFFREMKAILIEYI